jgi:hypothetical protein
VDAENEYANAIPISVAARIIQKPSYEHKNGGGNEGGICGATTLPVLLIYNQPPGTQWWVVSAAQLHVPHRRLDYLHTYILLHRR